MNLLQGIDFFLVESMLWIAEKKINVPAYDFQFSPLFQVARPRFEGIMPVVGRLGALDSYEAMYEACLEYGFELINNPAQHHKASELEHWYPDIEELTPKSVVFEHAPTVDEILEHFAFPVFIKGNRQTAKHNPALAIAHNEAALKSILKAYQQDNILHWQKLVCREYVPLQLLDYQVAHTVPLSFEFRTFWWKSQLVGAGRYWAQFLEYNWTPAQQAAALGIASIAAQRLQVPFLVIDLALTAEGKWLIIECNDGQESGYCGVNAWEMWRRVLEVESRNK